MVRGRPREFDERQALEAALDLFWRNGYEGTSCEELLSAMGINSGSMYAAFGDKCALYDKAFEHYCDTTVGGVLQILDQPGTPLENVKAMVQCWANHMASPERKGCFIDSTLIEFGKEKRGVAEMARRVTKRLTETLEKKLTDARDAGELSKSSNPAELAVFLVNTKQGLSVMSRAGAGKKAVRGVINTTLMLLKK